MAAPIPVIALMGEAMLELSHPAGESARLAYGGDTLNTAVYLARLGLAPNYVTALGPDPYSEGLLREWERECVQVGHVLRHPSRLPGLYAIQTDHLGERSFYYWRETSAARAFFDRPEHHGAVSFMAEADYLYISGITLSIFDEVERDVLGQTAAKVKARGGQVIFDPNYRPRGWDSAEAARAAFDRYCQHVTIALPTIDDENDLHGQKTGEAHVARWQDLGVETVILKCGPQGAIIFDRDKPADRVAIPKVVKPVDTTGAGDSFNAGFIAAHAQGLSLRASADWGNRLAGAVIQHPGAIIPRAAMPDLKVPA